VLQIGDRVIDARTEECLRDCGTIVERIPAEDNLKAHMYRVEFPDGSIRSVSPRFLIEVSFLFDQEDQ
jgi:hypothetical protein